MPLHHPFARLLFDLRRAVKIGATRADALDGWTWRGRRVTNGEAVAALDDDGKPARLAAEDEDGGNDHDPGDEDNVTPEQGERSGGR